MKMARTKINVYKGALSFEFNGEIVTFNIFDAMKYSKDSVQTQFCAPEIKQAHVYKYMILLNI